MIKQESGFTLIELLLVISILAVVSGAVYTTHISALRSWNFNRDRIDLQQSGRVILLNLAKDARNATTISQGDDDFADVDEMVLDEESENLEILLSNGQEVEYSLANRELRRENRVLTAAIVDELTLEKEEDGDKLIKISLELSHNRQEKRLIERVYLRAINW